MQSSTDMEDRILEINLISAQNLKIPASVKMGRMHTYALAWVDPRTKLRSDVDRVGGQNPTWNDKFLFRVSQDFINADTSAVQFQIYALGYIRDSFIGTVRYILSSSPISCRSGAVIGIPGFSALHIRRPSGRVHGVLNIAATVYYSSDFPTLTGISAICVRDLIGAINKNDERRCIGSKRSEQEQSSSSSSSSSCGLSSCEEEEEEEEESVYLSEDETDSTTSSFTTITAFRDENNVGSKLVMAGNNKQWESEGSLLCGLLSCRER